jgi:hypothetical protein
VKESIIPAALSVPGAVAGARLAASSVAPVAASLTPLPGLVLTGASALVGGFIGGGGGAVVGNLIDDLIFDEKDPIVLPSLQSSYNFGETLTYGISSLSTPLVAAKTPFKPVIESFQGLKFLENFKGVATGKLDLKGMENALIQRLGPAQYAKALQLRNQAPTTRSVTGKLKKILPDAKKGPVSVRAFQGLLEGVKNSTEFAKTNPKNFYWFRGIDGNSFGSRCFCCTRGCS